MRLLVIKYGSSYGPIGNNSDFGFILCIKGSLCGCCTEYITGQHEQEPRKHTITVFGIGCKSATHVGMITYQEVWTIMTQFRRLLIISAFIITVSILAGFMLTDRAEAAGNLGIYYVGQQGMVGWHMVAKSQAPCPGGWTSNTPFIIDGYLPPGLKQDGFKFVGTPSSPGSWQVKVRFTGVSCQGTNYKDEDVEVAFWINVPAPPAAPQ
jgi:hypothetical protein